MIDFCGKSLYTLFNTAPTALTPPQEYYSNHQLLHFLVADTRFNFLATFGEIPKHDNVIDSFSLINICFNYYSYKIQSMLYSLHESDILHRVFILGLGFMSREYSLKTLVACVCKGSYQKITSLSSEDPLIYISLVLQQYSHHNHISKWLVFVERVSAPYSTVHPNSNALAPPQEDSSAN